MSPFPEYHDDELEELRETFNTIFAKFNRETIQTLREKVIHGYIEGGVYFGESDDDGNPKPCGCVKGWLSEIISPASVATYSFDSIPCQASAIRDTFIKHGIDVVVYEGEPEEAFVCSIHYGDTPENDKYSAWLLETIDLFLAKSVEVSGEV